MDPLTLGIGIIGLGMSLAGKFKASADAQKMNTLEHEQAQLEMQINGQKKQQMELNGRRQMLEVARNTQRLRAQSVQAGVNQGAQYGSGLQGGQAQIAAQGNFNMLGIGQNLEIGRNIFGLNDSISGVKMQMSDVKTSLANDQAITSLGGAILTSSGKIGDLASNVFGTDSFQGNPWGAENYKVPKAFA